MQVPSPRFLRFASLSLALLLSGQTASAGIRPLAERVDDTQDGVDRSNRQIPPPPSNPPPPPPSQPRNDPPRNDPPRTDRPSNPPNSNNHDRPRGGGSSHENRNRNDRRTNHDNDNHRDDHKTHRSFVPGPTPPDWENKDRDFSRHHRPMPRRPDRGLWRIYGRSPYSYSMFGPYWGGYYYWNGCYRYWNGTAYSPYREYYYITDPGVETRTSPPAEAKELAFCFPPVPPPLGMPPPKEVPLSMLSPKAPSELADYVDDFFYPQLSTRLSQASLSTTLRDKLETYREHRRVLVEALKAKLAETDKLQAAERVSALAAFATEQAAGIKALEQEAEGLRKAFLYRGLNSLISGSNNWNDLREWRLGSGVYDNRMSSRLLFLVTRAAAYFENGLGLDQRHLAREAALELQVNAYAPEKSEQDVDETLLFFSPELSQLRLPADLSPSLRAKLLAYAQSRKQLRDELVACIEANDAKQEDERAKAFALLSQAQSPKIAALELVADDIRRELQERNNPFDPAISLGLSPELQARIAAFGEAQRKLNAELMDTYKDIQNLVYPTRVSLDPKTTEQASVNLRVEPRLGTSDQQLDQVKDKLSQFNASRETQFNTLAEEQKQLLRELNTVLASKDPSRKAETVLRDLIVWQSFRDYAKACFEPGLSLAQRRLLSGEGMRQLKLPLPTAE